MINAILNIDKDPGMTSTSVDKEVKKITGAKKIGHVGTLDPLATGVLPVFMGQATRLINLMNDKNKEYLCDLELGSISDTYDLEGKITKIQNKVSVSTESLLTVVSSFIGNSFQVPPKYSSVKYKGERSYNLVRKGIEFSLEPKLIYIEDIKILENNTPAVSLLVKCHQGVYIRSLINDIGEQLKCGAVLTKLRRIKSGIFNIDSSVSINHSINDHWKKHTIPIDNLIDYMPRLNTSNDEKYKLITGQPINISNPEIITDQEFVRCYDRENTFIGIAKYDKTNNFYLPHKIFLQVVE
ncbi:MAG: tRNA pseudouridine(55) synthase TruB [Chloroflexi bacterium]|nr:tRNA pseudouridine(55) synthase TruB [Chloroflexota bacterium]